MFLQKKGRFIVFSFRGKRYRIIWSRFLLFLLCLFLIFTVLVFAAMHHGRKDAGSNTKTPVIQLNDPYRSDNAIVKTAVSQVGSTDGSKYWKYCGYTNSVKWSGCFVSWCGAQNHYIKKGKMPKFTYIMEGVRWFKSHDRWEKSSSYKPKSGDLIFLDPDNIGTATQTGVVAGTRKDRVYTVEGDRKGGCVKMDYSLDSKIIVGYGKTN